jgi:predicted anti-sigma-YlaC factor YlaD
MVRKVKRKHRKRKLRRKDCWIIFAKRVAIMLFILFVSVGLIAAVGWEAVTASGIVREAANMLADAAADAFGEE